MSTKNKFPLNNIKQFLDLSDLTPEDLEQEVQRKQYTFELSIDDKDKRTAVADVSVKEVDHDGDIVISSGGDFSLFEKNPIILWSHRYNEPPVGKATQISVKEDKIQMKMQFAKTEKGNEIWELVKNKFLRACSIGFLIKKALYKGTKEFKAYVKETGLKVDDTVCRIITEFQVIENSLCSIPANPSALISAVSSKSLELSDDLKKDLNIEEKEEVEEKITITKTTVGDVSEEVTEIEKTEEKEVEGVNEVATEILEEEAKKEAEELVEEPEEYEMIDPEVEKILVEMRDNEIAAEVEVIEILPELKNVIRVGSVDIKKEIKHFQRKRKGKIV